MYYDDASNEVDPKMIPMPKLCLSCDKKDDPNEEIYCNLNRLDQRNDVEFKCYAYESSYGVLSDDIIE
jgi:hypothetical protein